MSGKSDSYYELKARSFSEIASIGIFTIGVVVLMGWIFDFPALKSVLPGVVTMKVNTALSFILLGIALWF